MHNWPCISDYDSDTPMFDYSAYEEEEDSGEARQNGVFASSLFLACCGTLFLCCVPVSTYDNVLAKSKLQIWAPLLLLPRNVLMLKTVYAITSEGPVFDWVFACLVLPSDLDGIVKELIILADLVNVDDQGACFYLAWKQDRMLFPFEEICHRCELVRSFLARIVTQIRILALPRCPLLLLLLLAHTQIFQVRLIL